VIADFHDLIASETSDQRGTGTSCPSIS
jgi:hypothetical protein